MGNLDLDFLCCHGHSRKQQNQSKKFHRRRRQDARHFLVLSRRPFGKLPTQSSSMLSGLSISDSEVEEILFSASGRRSSDSPFDSIATVGRLRIRLPSVLAL